MYLGSPVNPVFLRDYSVNSDLVFPDVPSEDEMGYRTSLDLVLEHVLHGLRSIPARDLNR